MSLRSSLRRLTPVGWLLLILCLVGAAAILATAYVARAQEPPSTATVTPTMSPAPTPEEKAAAAEQAAKPVPFSTQLTNWTGKNPWIWWVFWGAVGIDTVLRGIWPSRKARPKVVAGILALAAIPSLNLWIVVRVIVEGTAARFGYKLKLRLPSDSDGCPNPDCPAGCPTPSGSGVLSLPEAQTQPKVGP